jgi:hypothetical protein
MTEHDGGIPRDPHRDPDRETPPTQPVPDSSFGAEPDPARPADAGPGSFSGQRDTDAPYGPPGATAAYGQPGAPTTRYGYAAAPPKNDLGVWALVTGILSYVFCPLVLGIVAIVMGTKSRKAADEGLANNRGMGTAGLVLGWINVALVLIGVVLFFVALSAGLLSGGLGEWGNMNDMERYGDY